MMAIELRSNAFFSPALPDQSSVHPHDYIFECLCDTVDGGTDDYTMLTDTKKIGFAKYAFAINHTGTPKPTSISELGATVTINSANALHDVYVIGGREVAYNPPAFCLRRHSGEKRFFSTVYWEIIQSAMGGAGTLKVTADTSLKFIDKPLYVLPVEVLAAAPDADGCSINEISSIDFTVECGAAAEVVAMLVGGLREYDGTPADDAGTDKDLREGLPLILPHAQYRHPGDLVGEIINKTLDGADPSTVTITAADDCKVIRHIEMVLPVCTVAAEYAISWDGTQGKTSAIYSANGKADSVSCLVLGK